MLRGHGYGKGGTRGAGRSRIFIRMVSPRRIVTQRHGARMPTVAHPRSPADTVFHDASHFCPRPARGLSPRGLPAPPRQRPLSPASRRPCCSTASPALRPPLPASRSRHACGRTGIPKPPIRWWTSASPTGASTARTSRCRWSTAATSAISWRRRPAAGLRAAASDQAVGLGAPLPGAPPRRLLARRHHPAHAAAALDGRGCGSRAARNSWGFYLGGYTHDERFPVIESWAFGAPAHAPFVTAWQQEFHHALVTAGTDAYLAQVRGQDVRPHGCRASRTRPIC